MTKPETFSPVYLFDTWDTTYGLGTPPPREGELYSGPYANHRQATASDPVLVLCIQYTRNFPTIKVNTCFSGEITRPKRG